MSEVLGASEASIVLSRIDLVLDCLPRAVVVTDLSGTILAWNAVATVLYGWERAEVLGRPVQEVIVVASEARQAVSGVRDLVAHGTTWTGEFEVTRRDGTSTRTWSFVGPLLDANGQVVGVVSAADDARELVHLRQHASDLAGHLKLALSAGGLGTWRWDRDAGTVTWDPTMEALFGLSEGSFAGTFDAWVALLHPDEVEGTLAVVDRAMDDASPYQVEHRVTWPDGSVHWLQGYGRAMFGPDGSVIGAIGCTADVTERKSAELDAERRARRAERLAERERRQRERLEFLARVNDAARVATNHQMLMRSVTTAAVPQLGDWCALHFVPEPGQAPEVQVAHADPAKIAWAHELQGRYPYDPSGVVGVPAVIRSGTTEFLPDIDGALLREIVATSAYRDDPDVMTILEALDVTGTITVPLLTKRGTVGAMQFVSAESHRRYDEDDVALAEAAAGRIADALDNAWLLEHLRHTAMTLQSALLPAQLPDIVGVDIAVNYSAAGLTNEVGGDFYDVFAIDDRCWALVIGDVCGKGPEAAAVTSVARHTIRAAARHGAGHREVLEWINDALQGRPDAMFVTALYATLEQVDSSWQCTLVSGGHPRPVLVRADGTASLVGVHGTLLGIVADITTEPIVVVLHPGDTLMLYTDGLTDLAPPHDLDDDQLRHIVAEAARNDSAASVIRALGAEIESLLPIEQRHDDLALMVVRIPGPG